MTMTDLRMPEDYRAGEGEKRSVYAQIRQSKGWAERPNAG